VSLINIKKSNFVFAALIINWISLYNSSVFAKEYTLTVDAAKRIQPWNRFYEAGVATCHMNTVINTYWKRGISNALKVGHDEAGFKFFRGHGILHDDIGLVNTNADGSLILNWTRFDSVYTLAMNAGLKPILEISTTPKALASGTETVGDPYSVWYNGPAPNRTPPNKGGWDRWVALMDSIVTHCEKKWGVEEVRNNWYFEVWNEPEWWYMGLEYYNDLYDYTVTGLKQGDSLVRVGGPACGGNNVITGGRQFQDLLNHCHTEKNAATGKIGTPVDFLTYHWYGNNSVPIGIQGAVLNADNLAKMHRAVLDTLRKNYSWFKGQVLIDEVGPTSRTVVCRDQSSTASWLAKTVHLLNDNGPDYPPPSMMAYWAVSDLYEEFQNKLETLSFQEGNYGLFLRGNSSYQNSWEIPKPAFQAYRMLHKLGDFELESNGGTKDNGVNLIATCDSSNNFLQILVYNHYASDTQSSAPTDNITITVKNVPWTSGKVKSEHVVVDTTHSNTYTAWVKLGKPSVPSNAQWDALQNASTLENFDSITVTNVSGNTFIKSFPSHYFSVHLITLSNPDLVSVSHDRSKSSINNSKRCSFFLDGKILTTLPTFGAYTVTIYFPNGKIAAKGDFRKQSDISIPFSRFSKGVYLIKIESDDLYNIERLIVR
jgi:xylan 1,4-beta-xylosidase